MQDFNWLCQSFHVKWEELWFVAAGLKHTSFICPVRDCLHPQLCEGDILCLRALLIVGQHGLAVRSAKHHGRPVELRMAS